MTKTRHLVPHARFFGAYLANLSLGSDLLHSNRDNNCKKLWCGRPKAHINPPTTRTEACVPPRGVCAQWKAPPVCVGWQRPRFPMFAGWDRVFCHSILHISMMRSIYDEVNTRVVAPYRPDEAAYQFWCDSAGKYNIRAYLCTAC